MEKEYKECLRYIKNHWKKMTFYLPKDKKIHIGLPNRFVSPTTKEGIFKNDQFYWDSYFIILGLIVEGKINLARGMVENFAYLYKRFGIIPSRNRFYNLGISQPPFLTSMILEVFSKTKDKRWLKKTSLVAEEELKNYWEKGDHLAWKGLSRYADLCWCTHKTAEYESGWDLTSRFNEQTLDYLPVDLNSCLYKYETDLAEIFSILNEKRRQEEYLKKAKRRRKIINQLMWSNKKGFFFDYNCRLRRRSNFYSVAGFYPLWANLATKNQAERIRINLKKFEYKGGLANTQKGGLSKTFKQHDYPNGWPHQQWIAIRGLLNYGFKEDARRIAKKWLGMNKKVFEKTGKFWEKYNVVKSDVGKEGRYPNQHGFGWTNAVFIKIVDEFKKE